MQGGRYISTQEGESSKVMKSFSFKTYQQDPTGADFVGCKEFIETITDCDKDVNVLRGASIGNDNPYHKICLENLRMVRE